MRLFVLVTSAFAMHAKSMATVDDFKAVWLQMLSLMSVSLQRHACFPTHNIVLRCDWANKIRELDDAASYHSAIEVCCAALHASPPLSLTRGSYRFNSL